jgi:hypothetical protein
MRQFNLVQRPDIGDRLARSLKINERNPAPTLSPELQPVVIAEDLSVQSPYDSPLRRRAGSGVEVAAVAGQYSQIELTNPTDSGVVAMLKRMAFAAGASTNLSFGFKSGAVGALPATASRFWKDPRLAGPTLGGFPTAVMRYGSDPVVGVGYPFGYYRLSTTMLTGFEEQEVIIPPGFTFRASLLAVNVVLYAQLEWDEYTS